MVVVSMINDSGMVTELEYLCSQESFDKWLYEKYQLDAKEFLTDILYADFAKKTYIRDKGLPKDIELEF
jgi:hypothetical protein